MSIKYDKYNIITYLKNYGSDVFDPIDYYELNRNIYDKNFIELLKYILCLSGNKCKQIDESAKYLRKKIPEFEIIDDIKEVKIITLDTNQLKKFIKELIILINDLYKIFVMLYNLEMGFSYFIQKGNFDYLTQNKDSFENLLIKTNITEEDIENINNFNPNKDKFIPLKYKQYIINNLDQFNDEELIVLSEMLLEDTVNIEDSIMKLLKLSEKISFIMDIEQISKKILTNIIPKDYLKNEKNDVEDFMIMIGGKGLVIEAYDKLLELKKSLDDFSSISYEKEIPTGINLTVEQIKQLLKNLHIKIENDSATGLDTEAEKNLKKKKYEYNLFESIPGYVKIPDGKIITDPLEPKLPPQQDILSSFEKDISGNFNIINTKLIYFNEKIKAISDLINKLTTFYPKIKEYKENQLNFIKSLNDADFKFSNIGKKEDINVQILKLNGEITELGAQINTINDDITQKTESLNLYNNSDKLNELVDYLDKKKNRKKEEDENIVLLEKKEENINKLKIALLLLNKEGDKLGDKLIDIYTAYDKILKHKLKTNYDVGKFEEYINEEKWEEIQNLFVESHKKKRDNFPAGAKSRDNFSFNIYTLLNQNSREDIPKSYIDKIKPILDTLISSSSVSTLQTEITQIESSNISFKNIFDNIISTKPFTDPFWTDISGNINNMKSDIETEKTAIETEKTRLESEKIAKNNEKKTLEISLNSFIEEPKYNEIIVIDDNKFKEKIEFLHKIIENINTKISNIFLIKDGNATNPFIENIGTSLSAESYGWYKKNLFGGTVEKHIVTLKNINEFNEFNESLKKLLLKLDKYKSLSSDLLTIYIDTIKNIQDVIIYLYYKLTVFKTIKTNFFTIGIKLKKEELEKLKSEIIGLNRKNFDFIKEYYVKLIEKILSLIGEKTYVDNDIYNKTIFDLLILIHISTHVNNF